MKSPPETVNSVMEWLNERFALNLPTLPLHGWVGAVQALWRKLVSGPLPPPQEPLPWVIPVAEDWPELLPPNSTLKVTVTIVVHNGNLGSPY